MIGSYYSNKDTQLGRTVSGTVCALWIIAFGLFLLFGAAGCSGEKTLAIDQDVKYSLQNDTYTVRTFVQYGDHRWYGERRILDNVGLIYADGVSSDEVEQVKASQMEWAEIRLIELREKLKRRRDITVDLTM